MLKVGGTLVPLVVSHTETKGTGLMNPSILIDDEIYLNIRHTNYALYHNENNQRFYSVYGPLVYTNPENDPHLKTNNFLCYLGEDMSIKIQTKINTKKFDDKLVYDAEFHGLEDGRLVRWNNTIYLCGVRRDTEPTGIGRIEMSEICLENMATATEINRYRISPPDEGSKCEKNWMPVLDMPYHFVKWTNPLEIVKVIPEEGKSETVLQQHTQESGVGDLRGGSQVVTMGNYRLCLVHEVNLLKTMTGFKDAKYVHRFVIWDKDWNLIKFSEPFSFLNGDIEFCCGLGLYNGNVLITFGFQDNASYLLSIPVYEIEKFIGLTLGIVSKEKVFAPLYFISAEKFKKRQQQINNQSKKLKLERVVPVIITEEMDMNLEVKGKYVHTLDQPTLYAVASHLRAIKQWLKESKDEYAIFVEDDVNLMNMKYWSFTWDDFIRALPNDWDVIQMSCVRENLTEMKLKPRQWDDWSATAYLIKRHHAEKIIRQFYTNDIFLLDIDNLQPLVENILFTTGITYTIPLFNENVNFKSTSYGRVLKQKYKPNHYESAVFTDTWWREHGVSTNLNEIMS